MMLLFIINTLYLSECGYRQGGAVADSQIFFGMIQIISCNKFIAIFSLGFHFHICLSSNAVAVISPIFPVLAHQFLLLCHARSAVLM